MFIISYLKSIFRMLNSNFSLLLHVLFKNSSRIISCLFPNSVLRVVRFFRIINSSYRTTSCIVSLIFIPSMVISTKPRSFRDRKFRFKWYFTCFRYFFRNIRPWSNNSRCLIGGSQNTLPSYFSSKSKSVFRSGGYFRS